MSNTTIQAVSIRIPVELYAHLKRIAVSKRISFNKLTEQALRRTVQAQRDEEIRRSFAQIAQEKPKVDFAFEAQAEVALSDDG